ncbi:hypothetical protein D3C81_1386750 [compost metagenome]
MASVQTLTSGQRCVGSFGNFLHGTNVKGIARLFDPGDAQVFIAFAQTDSFRSGHAAAEVDVNFGRVTSDFHQLLDPLVGQFGELAVMGAALHVLQAAFVVLGGQRVAFERLVAVLHRALGGLSP